jgi:hypothetical protein
LREHTRLLLRATEWETGGRAENRLLSGSDITAAKAWSARRPKGAPELTALHLDFIKASESWDAHQRSEELRRLTEREHLIKQAEITQSEREAATHKLARRTAAGLIGAGTLTLLAAGLAYWGVDAEGRFRREQERAKRASEASLEAAIAGEAARADIEGVLTIFASDPRPDNNLLAADASQSRLSQSLLRAASDRNVSMEQAVRRARDEILRNSGVDTRTYMTTDLNADIYIRRNPPNRKLNGLIIGNNDYRYYSPLYFPASDAHSWAEFLKQDGFELTIRIDATRSEILDAFERAMEEMAAEARSHQNGERLATQTIAKPLFVFYYAGHGFRLEGKDYIVPVDVDLSKDPSSAGIDIKWFNDRARNSGGASIIIINTQRAELVLNQAK